MRFRFAIVLFAVVLLLVGCSSPHRVPTAPTPIPRLVQATMPPSAAQPTAPPTAAEPGAPAEDGNVAEGQQVFETSCAVCHNLTDAPKVGPGLAGLFAEQAELPNGQSFTEENLRAWITNGGGAMPGIPLGQAEMDNLIAFLQQETQ
jgi:cytochrome c2